MSTIDDSYALCGRIARRAAKNFYYSFLLLPRPERRAMCALYAFSRRSDDLSDNELPVAARRAALARWRESLEHALAGRYDDPILPALADTVVRYGIRPAHVHAVLDGVEMDLDRAAYETFDELTVYCERVASAVGQACIRIWRCDHPRAEDLARQCGIAFQLTNILRDLNEDLARGRVYLPQEDLRQFGYSAEMLRAGVRDCRFRSLMRFEIGRAEQFYNHGLELERYLSGHARPVFAAMAATYQALLAEIKRRDGDVLTSRVRLTPWHKWRIAAHSLVTHSRPLAWWRG